LNTIFFVCCCFLFIFVICFFVLIHFLSWFFRQRILFFFGIIDFISFFFICCIKLQFEKQNPPYSFFFEIFVSVERKLIIFLWGWCSKVFPKKKCISTQLLNHLLILFKSPRLLPCTHSSENLSKTRKKVHIITIIYPIIGFQVLLQKKKTITKIIFSEFYFANKKVIFQNVDFIETNMDFYYNWERAKY